MRVLMREEDTVEQVKIIFDKMGVQSKEMVKECMSEGMTLLQKKMTARTTPINPP